MTEEIQCGEDEKTHLLDPDGRMPGSVPLTNSAKPVRLEHLGARMVEAAQHGPTQALNSGLNSLVALAGGLLAELIRLGHKDGISEKTALNKRLADGVRDFHKRAQANGIESDQIRTAGYVLCTVLDEAVVNAHKDQESEWSRMSLLSHFHNETFGGEKFFQILEYLSKHPARHLPMLELMYLCLSLGFQGKYGRHKYGGRQHDGELEDIRDSLYRQIRQLRGDVPSGLSPHWEGLNAQRHNLVRIVPAWMVVLLTGTCLLAMFCGFAWVLHEHRGTALQSYQPVEAVAAVPQPQP